MTSPRTISPASSTSNYLDGIADRRLGRHPGHARRVPGGRGRALLPPAPDPGPAGHRPRLPRAPRFRRPRDLGTLVDDLPGILGSDRAGPPGRAACPSCSPRTPKRCRSHRRARRRARGRARSAPWPTWTSSQLSSIAGQLGGHRGTGCRRTVGPCTSGSTPSRPSWSSGTRRDEASVDGLLTDASRSDHEGAGSSRSCRSWFNELGLVHPRAAQLGPTLAAPALRAGRDLQSLSQPDRAGPAPPLGRDPPADRQGAAHLGRDPLRPGRHPRAPRRRHRPVPAHLRRPAPDRGAAAGADADLPLVPPRERGPGRIGAGRQRGARRAPRSPATPSRPHRHRHRPSGAPTVGSRLTGACPVGSGGA